MLIHQGLTVRAFLDLQGLKIVLGGRFRVNGDDALARQVDDDVWPARVRAGLLLKIGMGVQSCQFEDVPKGHFAPVAANGRGSPQCRGQVAGFRSETRSERSHLLHLPLHARDGADALLLERLGGFPKVGEGFFDGFHEPFHFCDLGFGFLLCLTLQSLEAFLSDVEEVFPLLFGQAAAQGRHAVLKGLFLPSCCSHHRLQLRDFGTVFRSRLGSLPARQGPRQSTHKGGQSNGDEGGFDGAHAHASASRVLERSGQRLAARGEDESEERRTRSPWP